ncbi:MAG: tetrahydrodipicolinate N-succinyltransferase N-terminal domain-containing protein [Pseudomonadales bacterium]|nr:tetrahydrodipicolinate N-succinyltransferase N-terminal domain-containing protein [Pseudomonadales bacterium]
MSTDIFSYAIGIGTQNSAGRWLEVFYPQPVFRPAAGEVERFAESAGYSGGNVAIELSPAQLSALAEQLPDTQAALANTVCQSSSPVVLTIIANDEAITSTPEAYLKLHLLSLRHVRPNEMNLEGIFAQLPNVAWTSRGAMDPEEVTAAQLQARMAGEVLEITAIDKFPRMTNYVIPGGVRIAHSARVRLGAYLGEGTTVMHEGFINFNAGTDGPNMVEGRLSQGVVMGAGSDLGGGASTMGTLSGGGQIVLSVGRDCLIGANGGTGIPLGDRCTIEAGLYITASTLVQVFDADRNFVRQVKARELAGQSDMLFIRNSSTGHVECRTNKNAITLNEELHAHN